MDEWIAWTRGDIAFWLWLALGILLIALEVFVT